MIYTERERFPTVPVDNKVLWVNPNFNLPFSLEVGKPTNLGKFLVNPQAGLENSLHLGVDKVHGRSALIGKIRIVDNTGVVYRDADISGGGYCNDTYGEPVQISPVKFYDAHTSPYGLRNLKKTLQERDITEDLAADGVRTSRIGAIWEIFEIAAPDGQKISVVEAKERGIIPYDMTPVETVRLYRVRERVHHPDPIRAELLHDAKDAVSHELGKDLSWDEYIIWFGATVGEQLFHVHQKKNGEPGYWNGFLRGHNVTLAGEIIDFGYSNGNKRLAGTWQLSQYNFGLREGDFKDAAYSLTDLLTETRHLGYTSNDARIESFRQFEQKYNEGFGTQYGQEEYFYAPIIHGQGDMDFYSPTTSPDWYARRNAQQYSRYVAQPSLAQRLRKMILRRS